MSFGRCYNVFMLIFRRKNLISSIFLILANFYVVFSVAFLGWDLFLVMFLFWAETAVIGFYSVFKIIKSSGKESIFWIPLFSAHFGVFMLGHLFVIVSLFGGGVNNHVLNFEDLFSFFSVQPLQVNTIIIPICLLFISHGYSFFFNYLGNKEYLLDKESLSPLFAPYSRVLLTHMTVIVAAVVINSNGSSIFALIFLVFIKTFVDLIIHNLQHK